MGQQAFHSPFENNILSASEKTKKLKFSKYDESAMFSTNVLLSRHNYSREGGDIFYGASQGINPPLPRLKSEICPFLRAGELEPVCKYLIFYQIFTS